MTDRKKVWLTAICYWIVVSLLCTLFYPVIMSDTVNRYAPMAEYFAQGEWSLAFHPRFGALFQILTGSVVKLLGVRGDAAAQIVGVGFLSFSVVPLWFLVRDLFGKQIAWWALALMLVSDDFTRYAFDGLRETGKCLGFALVGLGAVRKEPIWFALGLFVLASLVSYCFAVSSVLLFGWCVYWLWKRRISYTILPAIGWLLGSALVFMVTHAFTGHWLPSPHYIKFLGGWL